MWRVMAVLASKGGQRQIDLADLTSIEVSTLSRIVTRLVRMGVVTRTRSASSTREVVVKLTAKGNAQVARLIPDRPRLRSRGHCRTCGRRNWPCSSAACAASTPICKTGRCRRTRRRGAMAGPRPPPRSERGRRLCASNVTFLRAVSPLPFRGERAARRLLTKQHCKKHARICKGMRWPARRKSRFRVCWTSAGSAPSRSRCWSGRS